MSEQVPWPAPPREPGPWAGGPPVVPSGATAPRASASPPPPASTGNPWLSFAPPERPTEPQLAALPSSGLARQRMRRDRAPAWLLFLSALVVVAMVAGAVYVVVEGGRDYPDEWDERVASIADWVEKERELTFEHPVEVNFLSADEYSEMTTSEAADESDQQAMDDVVAQFRALGLVAGEVDFEEATNTLSDTGTLAFYDHHAEQVFVRGTELSPQLRVTLAHELVHVLQDQNFDLGRMESLPDERASVLRSLAEGDAERIEDVYVDEVLTRDEREVYEDQNDEDGESMDEIDEKVPPVLMAFFAAPYVFGPVLVDYLDRTGGDAIDEAFRNPPTEEVLFAPLMFGSDDAEPMSVEVTAPDGAEVIEESNFGPVAWYLVLAARMDPRVALAATYGLGGDDFVAYRQGEEICVRAYARGDDEAQTEELSAALGVWVAQSPKGTASAEVVDGVVHFQSCDPGSEAEAAGEVGIDMLALPVGRTQIYLEIVESGGTDAQARCMADGVIERLSFEEFTAAELSADAQASIFDLRDDCR